METNEMLQTILSKLEILGDGQTRLENKVDNLENKVDNLENKVDNLENKVDGIETKLDELQESLNEVRGSTNQLLEWAEEASVQVQIPLLKKAQ